VRGARGSGGGEAQREVAAVQMRSARRPMKYRRGNGRQRHAAGARRRCCFAAQVAAVKCMQQALCRGRRARCMPINRTRKGNARMARCCRVACARAVRRAARRHVVFTMASAKTAQNALVPPHACRPPFLRRTKVQVHVQASELLPVLCHAIHYAVPPVLLNIVARAARPPRPRYACCSEAVEVCEKNRKAGRVKGGYVDRRRCM